ncbi:class II glutamine amidotransferase [Ignicoccus hospitalis]|nr:hypothetical protein [Ignicoccus hospitalis]HIH90389.1 hypothetical protein [Desulfurococcaceae archaeon]
MCRMMAGTRPRFITNFVKVARKDGKGLPNGDGWGFAAYLADGTILIKKKLEPIWESLEPLPRAPFLLHARRAEKLPKSLEHVHPHVCNGVILAHNGNVEVPRPSGLKLYRRTSSEALACYFGALLASGRELEEALETVSKTVKPKPSANFVAIVTSASKLVIFNYHTGDRYYVMWKKEGVYASEPLGEGWQPLSEDGAPVWEVVDLKPS